MLEDLVELNLIRIHPVPVLGKHLWQIFNLKTQQWSWLFLQGEDLLTEHHIEAVGRTNLLYECFDNYHEFLKAHGEQATETAIQLATLGAHL